MGKIISAFRYIFGLEDVFASKHEKQAGSSINDEFILHGSAELYDEDIETGITDARASSHNAYYDDSDGDYYCNSDYFYNDD